MPTHLTARLAWHDDGWNGRVCQKPDCNTYCVGHKSFPGDVISRERDLGREKVLAGKPVSGLAGADLPPCVYSVNAFGAEKIQAYSKPPDFFYGGAKRTEWELPPATVCVWPYEVMYGDEGKTDGRLDNDKRLASSIEFFSVIEPDESLIFYYANYSNPFSEEDAPRYALIGVSRVSEVGPPLSYDDTTQKVRERYAGGMIWARNVSSHYPTQGLRLPYHRYRNDPDKLAQIALFPENPWTCKYGAKHLSNDAAIGLLEQFLHAVQALKDMRDDTEDWTVREQWLLGCIAELWSRRGLYPGLLGVMDYLRIHDAIKPARLLCDSGQDKTAYALFFGALDHGKPVAEMGLIGKPLASASRNWKLLDSGMQAVLRDLLPRLDFTPDQIEYVIGNKRRDHGIDMNLSELLENPYVISERYRGDRPDDIVAWSAIDRGVLPSPELGGTPLAEMEFNDARRLRALCVEQLRREQNQTFRAADNIVAEVDARLSRLPEWKRAAFSLQYFEVDRAIMDGALFQRNEGERLWLYLNEVHEDERLIEQELVSLAGRADIPVKKPTDDAFWTEAIRETSSPLATLAPAEYASAVAKQVKSCMQIFRRPLAVVTGQAGTGKTTVICALVRAIQRSEGEGAQVTVLTPTGKASDRVRAVFAQRKITGVEISTVHSFLAKGGWLNKNLTLKRFGGKQGTITGTLIVDEASMLDLALVAALVRAVSWQKLQRLILVGDPNQLPPIGRGRVFADLIEWLRTAHRHCIVQLTDNLRQLQNKVTDQGTGITRLADLYLTHTASGNEATSPEQEELLSLVHAGGDVDKDLSVVYWSDPTALAETLIKTVETKMAADLKKPLEGIRPDQLWRDAFDGQPERYQVLTPHRGELHGLEALNEELQARVSKWKIDNVGALDGITFFDKVIQFRNRPTSDPIWAYNFKIKRAQQIEIFNGELGFVEPHNFDREEAWARLKGGKARFWLKRFQVKFARKDHLAVNYGQELPTDRPGRFVTDKVEENLELAYAISIHKAQGSEFDRTFVIVPKATARTLSPELLYTAITRATGHCTLLCENNVAALLSARRRENSQTALINSSLFDRFRAVDDRLLHRSDWYEEGKIHEDLAGNMVRSKSELVIANLLHERGVPFDYEKLLIAPADGTFHLPDFTIIWKGETWFWEHVGRLDLPAYAERWKKKEAWYGKHFPGRLVTTEEGPTISKDAEALIRANFG